jgi:hypothetical protein
MLRKLIKVCQVEALETEWVFPNRLLPPFGGISLTFML